MSKPWGKVRGRRNDSDVLSTNLVEVVRDLGHISLSRKGIQFLADDVRKRIFGKHIVRQTVAEQRERDTVTSNLVPTMVNSEFADWNERGLGCI